MMGAAVAFCSLLPASHSLAWSGSVLVSTPNTSLLLHANEGEDLRFAYFGDRIEENQIHQIHDAWDGLNRTAYPTFGSPANQLFALQAVHADGNWTTDLTVDQVETTEEDNAKLTAITLKDNLSGTQAGLSYAATATWDGTSSTISATLNHVASKVTLKATNKLEAGNTLTLTVPQAYSGYNVRTATTTGEAEAYTHPYTTTAVSGTEEQPVELFSFYVLAANALQDLTVSCNNETATVPANLGGGKHIVLKGDISTKEYPHSTSLSVSIAGWGNAQELPFGGTDQLTDDTQASTSLQGAGTATDPYRITSAADLLRYMSRHAADENTHATLYTDIEISRTNWAPTYLDGTFNGGNHTISGTMSINSSNEYVGLFSEVFGTVSNLIMDVDMTVTGNGVACNTGSIAGLLQGGTIENCKNYGDIKASDTTAQYDNCTGGIVGYTQGGTIEDCTNTGVMTGGSGMFVYVGGIVGCNGGAKLENNVFNEGTPAKEAGN